MSRQDQQHTRASRIVFEGASAVFKSLVPQRAKIALPNADIPAPNAYNPNDKMTISHLPVPTRTPTFFPR